MTLYASTLPINLVVRILDLFLYEGDSKILYRAGMAILKIKEADLLKAKDFDRFMKILKEFSNPEFEDDDKFTKIAMGFNFTRKQMGVGFFVGNIFEII